MSRSKIVTLEHLAIFKTQMESMINEKIDLAVTQDSIFATEQDILDLFESDTIE